MERVEDNINVKEIEIKEADFFSAIKREEKLLPLELRKYMNEYLKVNSSCQIILRIPQSDFYLIAISNKILIINSSNMDLLTHIRSEEVAEEHLLEYKDFGLVEFEKQIVKISIDNFSRKFLIIVLQDSIQIVMTGKIITNLDFTPDIIYRVNPGDFVTDANLIIKNEQDSLILINSNNKILFFSSRSQKVFHTCDNIENFLLFSENILITSKDNEIFFHTLTKHYDDRIIEKPFNTINLNEILKENEEDNKEYKINYISKVNNKYICVGAYQKEKEADWKNVGDLNQNFYFLKIKEENNIIKVINILKSEFVFFYNDDIEFQNKPKFFSLYYPNYKLFLISSNQYKISEMYFLEEDFEGENPEDEILYKASFDDDKQLAMTKSLEGDHITTVLGLEIVDFKHNFYADDKIYIESNELATPPLALAINNEGKIITYYLVNKRDTQTVLSEVNRNSVEVKGKIIKSFKVNESKNEIKKDTSAGKAPEASESVGNKILQIREENKIELDDVPEFRIQVENNASETNINKEQASKSIPEKALDTNINEKALETNINKEQVSKNIPGKALESIIEKPSNDTNIIKEQASESLPDKDSDNIKLDEKLPEGAQPGLIIKGKKNKLKEKEDEENKRKFEEEKIRKDQEELKKTKLQMEKRIKDEENRVKTELDNFKKNEEIKLKEITDREIKEKQRIYKEIQDKEKIRLAQKEKELIEKEKEELMNRTYERLMDKLITKLNLYSKLIQTHFVDIESDFKKLDSNLQSFNSEKELDEFIKLSQIIIDEDKKTRKNIPSPNEISSFKENVSNLVEKKEILDRLLTKAEKYYKEDEIENLLLSFSSHNSSNELLEIKQKIDKKFPYLKRQIDSLKSYMGEIKNFQNGFSEMSLINQKLHIHNKYEGAFDKFKQEKYPIKNDKMKVNHFEAISQSSIYDTIMKKFEELYFDLDDKYSNSIQNKIEKVKYDLENLKTNFGRENSNGFSIGGNDIKNIYSRVKEDITYLGNNPKENVMLFKELNQKLTNVISNLEPKVNFVDDKPVDGVEMSVDDFFLKKKDKKKVQVIEEIKQEIDINSKEYLEKLLDQIKKKRIEREKKEIEFMQHMKIKEDDFKKKEIENLRKDENEKNVNDKNNKFGNIKINKNEENVNVNQPFNLVNKAQPIIPKTKSDNTIAFNKTELEFKNEDQTKQKIDNKNLKENIESTKEINKNNLISFSKQDDKNSNKNVSFFSNIQEKNKVPESSDKKELSVTTNNSLESDKSNTKDANQFQTNFSLFNKSIQANPLTNLDTKEEEKNLDGIKPKVKPEAKKEEEIKPNLQINTKNPFSIFDKKEKKTEENNAKDQQPEVKQVIPEIPKTDQTQVQENKAQLNDNKQSVSSEDVMNQFAENKICSPQIAETKSTTNIPIGNILNKLNAKPEENVGIQKPIVEIKKEEIKKEENVQPVKTQTGFSNLNLQNNFFNGQNQNNQQSNFLKTSNIPIQQVEVKPNIQQQPLNLNFNKQQGQSNFISNVNLNTNNSQTMNQPGFGAKREMSNPIQMGMSTNTNTTNTLTINPGHVFGTTGSGQSSGFGNFSNISNTQSFSNTASSSLTSGFGAISGGNNFTGFTKISNLSQPSNTIQQGFTQPPNNTQFFGNSNIPNQNQTAPPNKKLGEDYDVFG